MGSPETWQRWIGREQLVQDVMDPARAQALHATLERPDDPPRAGDPLPLLWHWIYFWSIVPMADLGPDGHQALGQFLPPIDLPQRMWAGSRFTFHRALSLGVPAERRSVITHVEAKEGRSGPLAFVTVEHRISDEEGVCLMEEQDLVFRGEQREGSARSHVKASPSDALAWSRRVTLDPVLLFRYSALTFNGHRIHYDRDFACGTEGYPGLIVHGPLLGLLMCQLAMDASGSRQAAGYSFRLLQPTFVHQAFVVAGLPETEDEGARLWVECEGALCAEGHLLFSAVAPPG